MVFSVEDVLFSGLYFFADSGTKKEGIRAFDGIPRTVTDPLNSIVTDR